MCQFDSPGATRRQPARLLVLRLRTGGRRLRTEFAIKAPVRETRDNDSGSGTTE